MDKEPDTPKYEIPVPTATHKIADLNAKGVGAQNARRKMYDEIKKIYKARVAEKIQQKRPDM